MRTLATTALSLVVGAALAGASPRPLNTTGLDTSLPNPIPTPAVAHDVLTFVAYQGGASLLTLYGSPAPAATEAVSLSSFPSASSLPEIFTSAPGTSSKIVSANPLVFRMEIGGAILEFPGPAVEGPETEIEIETPTLALFSSATEIPDDVASTQYFKVVLHESLGSVESSTTGNVSSLPASAPPYRMAIGDEIVEFFGHKAVDAGHHKRCLDPEEEYKNTEEVFNDDVLNNHDSNYSENNEDNDSEAEPGDGFQEEEIQDYPARELGTLTQTTTITRTMSRENTTSTKTEQALTHPQPTSAEFGTWADPACDSCHKWINNAPSEVQSSSSSSSSPPPTAITPHPLPTKFLFYPNLPDQRTMTVPCSKVPDPPPQCSSGASVMLVYKQQPTHYALFSTAVGLSGPAQTAAVASVESVWGSVGFVTLPVDRPLGDAPSKDISSANGDIGNAPLNITPPEMAPSQVAPSALVSAAVVPPAVPSAIVVPNASVKTQSPAPPAPPAVPSPPKWHAQTNVILAVSLSAALQLPSALQPSSAHQSSSAHQQPSATEQSAKPPPMPAPPPPSAPAAPAPSSAPIVPPPSGTATTLITADATRTLTKPSSTPTHTISWIPPPWDAAWTGGAAVISSASRWHAGVALLTALFTLM